ARSRRRPARRVAPWRSLSCVRSCSLLPVLGSQLPRARAGPTIGPGHGRDELRDRASRTAVVARRARITGRETVLRNEQVRDRRVAPPDQVEAAALEHAEVDRADPYRRGALAPDRL